MHVRSHDFFTSATVSNEKNTVSMQHYFSQFRHFFPHSSEFIFHNLDFVSLYSGKKIQNCEFSQKVAITCYNLFLFRGFHRFVADVCQKTDELAE